MGPRCAPDDWEHHFRWTNEIIGKDDPEYRLPGESPEQTSMRARGELHRYFKAMVADAGAASRRTTWSPSWCRARSTVCP